MTEFTYKKSIPIRNQKIRQFVKNNLKRPVKVLEVQDLKGNGHKYIGASLYKKNYIVVDKKLSVRDKYETVVHEAAHYKMREQNPKFGKQFIKEFKKTKMYKRLKGQGYSNKKLPEEGFATYYMKKKARIYPSKLREFQKKYPIVAKKFDQLSK